ncbi:MAG: efflux RND transporter periplasmic adaptor subunit [Desulfovibrio sp.]|nr:efflux RND transporter periplasmic adaptor subunit [Desulfovibrio sp.]
MKRSFGKAGGIPAILALGAALLASAACDKADTEDSAAAEVTYFSLTPRPATLTSELAGRTVPYMVAEVRPRVGGIILERRFVEGSDVREGDVLYQIDPSLYQAEYDRAVAALEQARATENSAALLAGRYREATRTHAVSRQDLDNAAAAHARAVARTAAAEAELEAAAIDLRHTAVTSPISGRIGWSSVTPGALVTGDQPDALATVQQLDPIYVDVAQSSAELLRLRKALASGLLTSGGPDATRVLLTLEDSSLYRNARSDPPGEPVAGLLKFSEVTVEESTGVVTIRAVFPNPDGVLLPGMYVRAVIEEGVNDKALLIPKASVTRNNRGQPTVYILSRRESGSPDLYDVRTVVPVVDRVMGDHYLVTAGPAAGDLIVLKGTALIRSGKPVKGVPDPDYAYGKSGASP